MTSDHLCKAKEWLCYTPGVIVRVCLSFLARLFEKRRAYAIPKAWLSEYASAYAFAFASAFGFVSASVSGLTNVNHLRLGLFLTMYKG